MTESSKQFATGGEENWQRMVRLLRDERCVGRADLMADAAKMIERLVGYLDNASAASEAKACPLCHGYSSEHCFVSVCPMKTETTPSEIAPNVLEALQTINEMACYACEEDIDSRYAMLLRIGETARAILNAAPQASPSVAPAVHVGPAVAAPASAPSATPCSGWIPVGERMPEKETETCSVDAVFKDVHGDGFVGYAYLDEAYKGKAFCRASRSNKMFTHWKPLAEATHG